MLVTALSLALGACSAREGGRRDDVGERFSPAADMFKIRNVVLGTCMRLDESAALADGNQVYQSRCEVDSASLWWREDCADGHCAYVNAASDSLCLAASGSITTSEGTYEVYAPPCDDDPHQQWTIVDRGDERYQLENRETQACAYATLRETTSQGFPQTVQSSCDSVSGRLLFEFMSDGGGGSGGEAESDGNDGGGGEITHVGTTEVYDSDGQDLSIVRPPESEAGDLLVLFLHRTDDDLPLRVDGWTRAAECYKRNNEYDCSTEQDCTEYHNDDFCAEFGEYGGGGHDLAQSVFYRTVDSEEPESYEFDLNVLDSSGHPGWAILTALRGAATVDPVRDWSHEGCDGDSDSVFPSVHGEPGDMVLLSQSFDDATAQSNFGAPDGTSSLGYVSQSDEAGFLFGGLLASSGETGAMETQGDGASSCKDALVSLTIRAQ